MLPIVSKLAAPASPADLRVDLRFALGGNYLREFFSCGLAPERTVAFARSAMLSRYVGVIRFFVGDDWFVDLICDTTDIKRDVPHLAPVIAACAPNPAVAAELSRFFEVNGASVVVA